MGKRQVWHEHHPMLYLTVPVQSMTCAGCQRLQVKQIGTDQRLGTIDRRIRNCREGLHGRFVPPPRQPLRKQTGGRTLKTTIGKTLKKIQVGMNASIVQLWDPGTSICWTANRTVRIVMAQLYPPELPVGHPQFGKSNAVRMQERDLTKCGSERRP